MAVDFKEMSRTEGLKHLRQLAQSPGWVLLKTQWQRLALLREQEKAQSLRSGGAAAIYLQGKVDGLVESASLLDTLLKELTVEPEEPPTY